MAIEITNKAGNTAKIFASTIDDNVIEQVTQMINYEPYINNKVRVMPDCHGGKGCVIGCTMTIKDKIAPNLTGVDLGCGVLAVKLADKDPDLEKLDQVINDFIPHGFNIHKKMKARFDYRDLRCRVSLKKADYSLGSLGTGNHYIELNKDLKGYLYLVIHSGSRKLGLDVCNYYQNLAYNKLSSTKEEVQEVIAKLKAEGREKEIQAELKKIKKEDIHKDLAYLEGQDFKDYIHDIKIIQDYASLNRKVMADIIIKKMGFTEEQRIETVHNYIDTEEMILRKGAVRAKKDEIIIIPINMRDGSLICRGKGNPDFNYSAPHGAGRLMSRTKAFDNLDMEEYKETMKDIYTTSVQKDTLDEAPMAYKPMQEIIDNIEPTAEVLFQIKPIYNFKSHK